MATIWDVLGIEPTTDEREIRRAYARELKLHRPEHDPYGFQELREAFDSAKRYAHSEVTLPDVSTTSPEDSGPEPTPMVAYIHQLMQDKTALPEESWDRDTLWYNAQNIANLLIEDELKGLGKLHQYLDNEISDALEARQTFNLLLAEALGEQVGLNRNILNEVSAVMNWQVERYHSSILPDWARSTLEAQITHTETENYWQFLEKQHSDSRLGRLKWRMLAEKGTPIPWWGRVIPDFLLQLVRLVSEILQQYPALQERLNPVLLNEYYKPRIALSWNTIITILFWGYTAWLPGRESPKMAYQSGLMLVVVIAFIWGYPALNYRFRMNDALSKCIHSFFWLLSVLILAMVLYRAWKGASAWSGKDEITIRVLFIVAFIIVPVVWALWQQRADWRTIPTRIVALVMAFPTLFIRQLPPLVNVLGMMLLPMLYGIIIEMVFFVK